MARSQHNDFQRPPDASPLPTLVPTAGDRKRAHHAGLTEVLLESINCFNATEREGLKVGFVGLGQMGKPMAMNLLKSSTQLLVNSASAKTYPDFEANGERTTKKLKELAETDLTFLCLPSSEVVRSEQGPPNG
jgi:phosphoglycerate dehydrogenase-like enzyme